MESWALALLSFIFDGSDIPQDARAHQSSVASSISMTSVSMQRLLEYTGIRVGLHSKGLRMVGLSMVNEFKYMGTSLRTRRLMTTILI
jgi:hypothetical protein